MDTFKTALQAYLKNEISFEQLFEQLEQSLKQQPDAAPEILNWLAEQRDARKLPLRDYAKLELHLLQVGKQSEQKPAPEARSTWRAPEAWAEGWERETPLRPGNGLVLKQSFRLKQRLAQGLTGEVWQALDLAAGDQAGAERQVVIKFLSTEFNRYPQAVKHFAAQFDRYRQLNHANLVKVHDLGRSGGSVFVSMERVGGLPLEKLIEQSPTGLPPDEVRIIMEGIARALTHAYQQGMAHLDLTPHNVFYEPVRQAVKVLDFGLIKLIRRIAGEQSDDLLERLEVAADAYASCETLGELDKPEPADGVYSLACLAYELLTGSHPFGRKSCYEARAKNYLPTPVKTLSAPQWNVLRKGLAFERRQRPTTPAKFVAELFPRQTHRLTLGLIGAGALAAGVLLAIGLYFLFSADWRERELIEGIQAGEVESVVRLSQLPATRQAELLRDHPELRPAVVDVYLTRPEAEVFIGLEQHPPAIRRALLEDATVQARLLAHYRQLEDNAEQPAELVEARTWLEKLEKIYPRALDYPEHQARLATQEQALIQELANRYQECLDMATPLRERTDCLLEARQGIALLNPDHELLRDPRLPALYQAETEKFLNQGFHTQAELVLQDWARILPRNSPLRDSLHGMLEIGQDLQTLLVAEEFNAADLLLKEAVALYPEAELFARFATQLKEDRAAREAELKAKYQAYLEQGKYLPDDGSEDIFDARTQLQRLDPEHPLLKDEKLHRAFFDRVIALLAKEEDVFEKITHLHAAWKRLFQDSRHFTPASQELYERARNRISLYYLVEGERLAEKGDIGAARERLEFALNLEPVDSARERLREALAELEPKAPAVAETPSLESATTGAGSR